MFITRRRLLFFAFLKNSAGATLKRLLSSLSDQKIGSGAAFKLAAPGESGSATLVPALMCYLLIPGLSSGSSSSATRKFKSRIDMIGKRDFYHLVFYKEFIKIDCFFEKMSSGICLPLKYLTIVALFPCLFSFLHSHVCKLPSNSNYTQKNLFFWSRDSPDIRLI